MSGDKHTNGELCKCVNAGDEKGYRAIHNDAGWPQKKSKEANHEKSFGGAWMFLLIPFLEMRSPFAIEIGNR